MPIPNPKQGEERKDYISRCISVIHGEYNVEGQAAAVCNSTWRKAKGEIDMAELTAQILKPGTWNGIPITAKDINDTIKNFTSKIPLKLGHNKKQKMTDGHPAMGWISKLWKDSAGNLMAKLSDIPEVVYKAIEAKLYNNVSIEGNFYKDRGLVLKALALIGADLPAVETLDDLQAYLSQHDIKDEHIGDAIIFSIQDIDIGENQMTLEELQAKFNALEVRFSTQEATHKLAIDVKVAEIAAKQKEIDDAKAAQAKVAFTREKEDVVKDLEVLTKAKIITPAKRDGLIADFTEEGAEKVRFALDTLKDGVPKEILEGGSTASDAKDDDEGLLPDAKVHSLAVAYSAEHKVEYGVAVDVVLTTNPKLAREYVDQNDMEA